MGKAIYWWVLTPWYDFVYNVCQLLITYSVTCNDWDNINYPSSSSSNHGLERVWTLVSLACCQATYRFGCNERLQNGKLQAFRKTLRMCGIPQRRAKLQMRLKTCHWEKEIKNIIAEKTWSLPYNSKNIINCIIIFCIVITCMPSAMQMVVHAGLSSYILLLVNFSKSLFNLSHLHF